MLFPPTAQEIDAAKRAGIAYQGLSGPQLRKKLAATRRSRQVVDKSKLAEYGKLLKQAKELGLNPPRGIKLPELMELFGQALSAHLTQRGIVAGARITVPPNVLSRHGIATVGSLHVNRLPATITLKFNGNKRAFGFVAYLVLKHAQVINKR